MDKKDLMSQILSNDKIKIDSFNQLVELDLISVYFGRMSLYPYFYLIESINRSVIICPQKWEICPGKTYKNGLCETFFYRSLSQKNKKKILNLVYTSWENEFKVGNISIEFYNLKDTFEDFLEGYDREIPHYYDE